MKLTCIGTKGYSQIVLPSSLHKIVYNEAMKNEPSKSVAVKLNKSYILTYRFQRQVQYGCCKEFHESLF